MNQLAAGYLQEITRWQDMYAEVAKDRNEWFCRCVALVKFIPMTVGYLSPELERARQGARDLLEQRDILAQEVACLTESGGWITIEQSALLLQKIRGNRPLVQALLQWFHLDQLDHLKSEDYDACVTYINSFREASL